jgi:polyhydroxybutyrate depolymerase
MAVVWATVVAMVLCTPGTGTAAASTGGGAISGASSGRSSGCGRPMAAGTVSPGHQATISISTDGIASSYQLTVPRSYHPGVADPVILLFYGWLSNASQFSAQTGLPAAAARRGYLVAVPTTPASQWQFNAHGTDADRVDAVVGEISRAYCVDQHRIYASGFSAGAAFTILYSCARQGRIAAIATAAVEYQLGCTRPMPVLAFHGTTDPFVPYQNDAIGLSLPGVRVRGTQLNMGDWARLDGCRRTPTARQVGAHVQRQVWPMCRDGTSVLLYTIVGGGHAWPGADGQWVLGPDGPPMDEIDATALVVDFFGQHRLAR